MREPLTVAAGYDFGSIQVDLDRSLADRIRDLGRAIPEADLAADGRELRPHITVWYGLTTADPDLVKRALGGVRTLHATLGETRVFETEDADVVYLSVRSPELEALYAHLVDSLPGVETHLVYVPHVTVAYVKPGLGARYAGDDTLSGRGTGFDRVVFSPAGDLPDTIIPLGKSYEWTSRYADAIVAASSQHWQEGIEVLLEHLDHLDADRVLGLFGEGAGEVQRALGGAGSGNFGHEGRPGEVGGSRPAIDGLSDRIKKNIEEWRVKTGNTREVMAERVQSVYNRATPEERRAGQAWYQDAHNEAERLAGAYGLTSHQAAGVIAALSPLREWSANKADAQALLKSIVSGTADPAVAKLLQANVAKATKIAQGADPRDVLWAGEGGFKVRSFYSNINDPDSREATIDTHMLRILLADNSIQSHGYGAIAGNKGRYDAFRQAIFDVADKEGISPAAVQATVWLRQKAENPNRHEVGGRLKAAAADDQMLPLLLDAIAALFHPDELRTAGGAGSGNFGHAGRPHEVGGSAPSITETAAFKAWFKDSKVVDDKGHPLVVYHGTPSGGAESNNRDVRSEQADVMYPPIESFDTQMGGITDSGWLGQGSYFTPDPDYAHEFGDILMPVYLSIQKPFEITDDSSNSAENNLRFLQSVQHLDGLPESLKIDLSVPPPTTYFSSYYNKDITVTPGVFENTYEPADKRWALIEQTDLSKPGTGVVTSQGRTRDEAIFKAKYGDKFNWFLSKIITRDIGPVGFRKLLEKNGYDGVIQRNERAEISEIVAYEPTQIKSAIGNRGTFDPHNPLIVMGGRGSGNFDHKGRPGERGGSLPGQFTSGLDPRKIGDPYGTGEFFHGGSAEYRHLQQILKEGIKGSLSGKFYSDMAKPGLSYVSTSEQNAEEWARDKAIQSVDRANQLSNFEMGTIQVPMAVLRVEIPKTEIDKIAFDPNFQDTSPEREFHGDIKPEWITGVKVARVTASTTHMDSVQEWRILSPEEIAQYRANAARDTVTFYVPLVFAPTPLRTAGSAKSGNFSHKGRPGEVGGSVARDPRKDKVPARGTNYPLAFDFASQVDQYPATGDPGVGYFRGDLNEKNQQGEEMHVDTLLFRDETGKVRGILNHYPMNMSFQPNPKGMWMLVEKAGNVNVIVDPTAQKQGIATQLVDEAIKRWDIDLSKQDYTAQGRKFFRGYVERKKLRTAGNEHSGNYGHAGRPHQIGGSAPRGIWSAQEEKPDVHGIVNDPISVNLQRMPPNESHRFLFDPETDRFVMGLRDQLTGPMHAEMVEENAPKVFDRQVRGALSGPRNGDAGHLSFEYHDITDRENRPDDFLKAIEYFIHEGGATRETTVVGLERILNVPDGTPLGEAFPEFFHRAAGGAGSGNFGHGGRPGEVGGSRTTNGGAAALAAQATALSRTSKGVVDTSSSKDKPGLAAKGQQLVDRVANNTLAAAALAYSTEAVKSPEQLQTFIENLNRTLNNGLTDKLYREHEITKYPATLVAELQKGMQSFSRELFDRLKSGDGPVGTAAWVEHQFNNIHPFSDAVGRTTLLLSNWTLQRAGHALPTYPDRKAYYAKASQDLATFTEFYRTLFPPRTLGGAGSGNFGHAGRPGEVGGSKFNDVYSPFRDVRIPVPSKLLGRPEIAPDGAPTIAHVVHEDFDISKMTRRRFAYRPKDNTLVIGDADGHTVTMGDGNLAAEYTHADMIDAAAGYQVSPDEFDSFLLRGFIGVQSRYFSEASARDTPSGRIQIYNKNLTGLDQPTYDDATAALISKLIAYGHVTSGTKLERSGTGEEFGKPITNTEFGYLTSPRKRQRAAGGQGSGNFGHEGRPGEVGGSAAGWGDHPDVKQFLAKHPAYAPELQAYAETHGVEAMHREISTHMRDDIPSYDFQMEVFQKGIKRQRAEHKKAKAEAGAARKPALAEQLRTKYGLEEGDKVFDRETGQPGTVKFDNRGQPYVHTRDYGNALVGSRWEKRTAAGFDPSEARDDHGRWTDGGGGALSGVAAALAKADGGFTYSPVSGRSPTEGYALSLHKDREKVIDAFEATVVELARFAAQNQDLLADPHNYMGGWHNPEDGKVYLDVSTVVDSEDEALKLATNHDQLAYFDLKAGKSIPTRKAS